MKTFENYQSNYQPTLISYATETNSNQLRIGFITDVFFSVENTDIHYLGGIRHLKGKKWVSFCVTWNGKGGYTKIIVDGVDRTSSGVSVGQNVVVPGKGVWILANEQDTYGGGLSNLQGMKGGLAQVNVWDYVLSRNTMKGLAIGASSIEGNLLRWTDFISNRNPDGSFTMETFQFYLPNAIVQKKRDDFCNTQYNGFKCPVDPLFARIGKTYPVGSNGNGWRCYCKSSLKYDKTANEVPTHNNNDYISDSRIKDIF